MYFWLNSYCRKKNRIYLKRNSVENEMINSNGTQFEDDPSKVGF